ncbi:MAG: hypothetical protein LBJ67_06295 [Planctomycetaceae bacterium]|jgi:hypothetical protein|nr:hypothetical protein [Planctomycetaceae bacterium]
MKKTVLRVSVVITALCTMAGISLFTSDLSLCERLDTSIIYGGAGSCRVDGANFGTCAGGNTCNQVLCNYNATNGNYYCGTSTTNEKLREAWRKACGWAEQGKAVCSHTIVHCHRIHTCNVSSDISYANCVSRLVPWDSSPEGNDSGGYHFAVQEWYCVTNATTLSRDKSDYFADGLNCGN